MPRRSAIWWYAAKKQWCVTVYGRRYHLGADKKAAEKRFHQLKASGSKEAVDAPDATLAILVSKYLCWQEPRISTSCYKSYLWYLGLLVKHYGRGRLATTLDADDVREWVDSHASWNPTTRTICCQRIKSAWRHALKRGWIATNPLQWLQGPGELSRESALTPGQYSAVANCAEGSLGDLLAFLWETGCRPTEAYRLEAKHVDWQTKAIQMPGKTTHKTGKLRLVYLTSSAFAILERNKPANNNGAIFLNGQSDPWTFFSVAARLRKLGAKLGIPGLSASHFRRGFATDAAVRGVPVPLIAELMGHSSPKQLMKHYMKVHNRQPEIRAALEQIRPSSVPPSQAAPDASARHAQQVVAPSVSSAPCKPRKRPR